MRTKTEPNTRARWGQTANTTNTEPREVRDAQTSVAEQHVPRRISEETTLLEHPVPITRQEALDGYRQNTVGGRERGEQHFELCVSFISRSTRHDALRLQREVST